MSRESNSGGASEELLYARTSETAAVPLKMQKRPKRGLAKARGSGQALVETALILPFLLLLLLGFLQLVLIGAAALAVSDAAASCARYAALNPVVAQGGVDSYLRTVASPVINDSHLGPITVAPAGTPRVTGSPVSVTVSYDLAGKVVLQNPFLGVAFPTTISVTETMTSE